MGIIGNELTLFFISVLGHHLDSLENLHPKISRTGRLVEDMKGNHWE